MELSQPVFLCEYEEADGQIRRSLFLYHRKGAKRMLPEKKEQ